MSKLDLKTPYEELTELRSVLTNREIAELTGLRRETLSRARPGIRVQRRTAKALDDLYFVVVRLRPLLGDDTTHLAAVLRRPQKALGRQSIADLLREGRAEEAVDHLTSSVPEEDGRLENLRLDPVVEAALRVPGATSSADSERNPTAADPAQLLADDPELGSRLPAIEAAIRDRLGDDVEIVREVIVEPSNPDGRDELYLRVVTGLSFDEEVRRLEDLLSEEADLLSPVRRRLTIGFL